MRLWIDDIRPAPTGFIWVKTVKEAKAATERIVNHGEAAVCRVHHTDNVEVLRDGE